LALTPYGGGSNGTDFRDYRHRTATTWLEKSSVWEFWAGYARIIDFCYQSVNPPGPAGETVGELLPISEALRQATKMRSAHFSCLQRATLIAIAPHVTAA
jgi:hypothetical protein